MFLLLCILKHRFRSDLCQCHIQLRWSIFPQVSRIYLVSSLSLARLFIDILIHHRRILDSLDPANENNPEAKARGYIYAFLAFLSLLCKAEADVIHLWHGRRASTRIRSELMASIYAKALVRKDYSGIIDEKDVGQRKNDDKRIYSTDPTRGRIKDDPNKRKKSESKGLKGDTKNTPGADVGKIVQLMSGDANRVSQIVSGAYFIYVSSLHGTHVARHGPHIPSTLGSALRNHHSIRVSISVCYLPRRSGVDLMFLSDSLVYLHLLVLPAWRWCPL